MRNTVEMNQRKLIIRIDPIPYTICHFGADSPVSANTEHCTSDQTHETVKNSNIFHSIQFLQNQNENMQKCYEINTSKHIFKSRKIVTKQRPLHESYSSLRGITKHTIITIIIKKWKSMIIINCRYTIVYWVERLITAMHLFSKAMIST